jgi:hypothetical protein
MAKGFKHGAGGPGLNFKVIGNPQPETARENTIWVDTDKINNYYFSSEQPENMVDYDVWFTTGSFSTVAFNALKKNGIQVYPISAKQYVSGALVRKDACCFQNGVWDYLTTYLFKDGNQFTAITGGWGSSGYTYYSGYAKDEPTVGGTIAVKVNGDNNYCPCGTQLPIDLSKFNTLYAMVEDVTKIVNIAIVGDGRNLFNPIAVATTEKAGTLKLDIPEGTAKVYVAVFSTGGSSGADRAGVISKVWCE